LRRIHQELLLLAKFVRLAIGDQSIRNIPKGVLDNSLIGEHGLLLLGFRQADIGPQSAGSKDRLRERSPKIPQSRWAGEQLVNAEL
jgi:hypothetical protein